MTTASVRGPVRRRRRANRAETVSGWLFTAPTIIVLGLFLAVPVLMAAWVSVSDWQGVGSPFASGVQFVGGQNYAKILGGGGLDEQNFGTALRNNLWYVVFVVPLQTAVALGLAVLVNGRALRARGFFRTAFYFPSVTSSVAITVLWLFLFSSSGAVNKILGGSASTGRTGSTSRPACSTWVPVTHRPGSPTTPRSGSRGGSGWPVRRSR